MTFEIDLIQAVDAAKGALMDAERALSAFRTRPEFHTYPTLDDALGKLEDMFESQAYEDCQGAHNCGSEEYSQEFIVDGVHYIATMTFEYNRHDKTYYYIDDSEFSYKVK